MMGCCWCRALDSGVARQDAIPGGEHGLDPEDWAEFRRACHETLDDAIDSLDGVRERPVWLPTPESVLAALDEPLPRKPTPGPELRRALLDLIAPYGVGNTHPRFFGWVHGSGTAQALIPEIWKSVLNVNAGGRSHIGTHLERRVIEWGRRLLGLPESTSGVLTSGTSGATLICLGVARNRTLGPDARKTGLNAGSAPLVVYCSGEAHSSVGKACEVLGLGRDFVRSIEVDGVNRMRPDSLRGAIARDRGAGLRPCAVCATVGTVNTGAIDPVPEIAGVCAEFGVWLHVDGAFGVGTALSDELRHLVAGVERADSVAFDFHKWMHAPYAVGCALLRDGAEHERAFGMPAPYLATIGRGLAADRPWACDLGIELSRPFYALAVWYTLKRFGTDALGALVEQNCAQARALGERISRTPGLELLAPVSLNIVCFRYHPERVDPGEPLDRLNLALVGELHERGLFAPSVTRVDGCAAIRVCLTNHRTRSSDLVALLESVSAIGAELSDREGGWSTAQ